MTEQPVTLHITASPHNIQTIRDLVTAEYGDSMRLDINTSTPGLDAPPAPGDEQLPAHILALLDLPVYVATACTTAAACEAASERNAGDEWVHAVLLAHAERLKVRCKKQQKFTGQACASGYHRACGCPPLQVCDTCQGVTPGVPMQDVEPADLVGFITTEPPTTAEADVSKVHALLTTWLSAGPPPLGTSISRWWDRRLAELTQALTEQHPAPDPTSERATLEAELKAAQAAIARVRAFAEDMRTWCSPHGVATDYADRLLATLDQPTEH